MRGSNCAGNPSDHFRAKERIQGSTLTGSSRRDRKRDRRGSEASSDAGSESSEASEEGPIGLDEDRGLDWFPARWLNRSKWFPELLPSRKRT
jgi:hypothetical protein